MKNIKIYRKNKYNTDNQDCLFLTSFDVAERHKDNTHSSSQQYADFFVGK